MPFPTIDYSHVSATEWAYAAGLFDGEGHIAINYRKAKVESAAPKSRYDRYSLELSMSQNNAEAVMWLKQKFGGSARFVVGKRSYDNGFYRRWNWTLPARSAEQFLRGCAPYFLVKKEEAVVALEFQATKKCGNQPRHTPTGVELRARQAVFWRRIREVRGTKAVMAAEGANAIA